MVARPSTAAGALPGLPADLRREVNDETYTGIVRNAHGEWFTAGAAEKCFRIPAGTLHGYMNGHGAWPPGVVPRVDLLIVPGRGRRGKVRVLHRETLEALQAPRQSRGPMKEPAAIKFQREFLEKSGRLPMMLEVAKYVKVWPTTLYAWLDFMAARSALAAKPGVRKPWGGRAPTGKEDVAIGFLRDHVRIAGGIPSQTDIARLVRVAEGTVRRWKRYQAARRAEAAALGIYPRVGYAEGKKELVAAGEKAVAFIQRTMDGTGWPPTWAEIADAAERPVGTVKKLPKVQHAYKMGASRVIKRTPWGTPKSVQEARALAYLVEQKTAGSVPSIEQIATGIGAGAFTFRCRPVFRAAYAEAARDGNGADGKIRQQRLQRPAAETGNGAAGDGSVLDAEFKKALEHFGKEIPSGQSATQKAQVVAAWKRDERLTYPGIRDWFRDMVPASEYQVGGGGPGTDRIKKLVKRGCALLGLS